MTGFNVESSLISVAIGVVIPGLVALISREHASDALKAFLSALLTAVSGALTGALAALPHGWHDWEAILWSIFIAWVAAAVSYFTGWKPSGASGKIAAKTANFGIGSAGPEAGYARVVLFAASIVLGGLLAAATPMVLRLVIAAVFVAGGVFVIVTVTALVYDQGRRTLQKRGREARRVRPEQNVSQSRLRRERVRRVVVLARRPEPLTGPKAKAGSLKGQQQPRMLDEVARAL